MRQTWHAYRFLAAAGVSVLLHLALAMALASAPPIQAPDRSSTELGIVWDQPITDLPASEPPPPPPAAAPPQPPEVPTVPPPRLQLGLEDSAATDTNTWLGFTEATEHQAPQSTIEQPELVLNPPSAATPAQAGQPAPQSPPPSPAPAAPPTPPTPPPAEPVPAKPAPSDILVAAPKPEAPAALGAPDGKKDTVPGAKATRAGLPTPAPPAPPPTDRPKEPEPDRPSDDPGTPPVPPAPEGDPDGPDATPRDAAEGKVDGSEVAPPPDAVDSPLAVAPAPGTPTPDDAAADPSTPPTQPPATPAQPAPSPATEPSPPGIVGDRESSATALTKPLEIRPGRTLAIKGQIEVRTKRPVFTRLVRLTASPTSVTIRAEFNAQGVVVRHHWVKATGYRDIDDPVADALYRFRASGPAIRALADPSTAPPEPAPAKPSSPGESATERPPERTLSLTFVIILS